MWRTKSWRRSSHSLHLPRARLLPSVLSCNKRLDDSKSVISAPNQSHKFLLMSCSKPLPPFTYELMCYLNRDQLDRFTIVCRSLKNLIQRYFPYRVFHRLSIRAGMFALFHNGVQWHPNKVDYSVPQFLAGREWKLERKWNDVTFYSFAEMRPYLAGTIRIKETTIYVSGNSLFNAAHIEEMESVAYLWRQGNISIKNDVGHGLPLGSEDFQSILNSATILQCQELDFNNVLFSFKNYPALYTVRSIVIFYPYDPYDVYENMIDLWQKYWMEFLEKPGVKPIVVFRYIRREYIEILLDRLRKAFSAAVMPNAFRIRFEQFDRPLIEFRETNSYSGQALELKKELPLECVNFTLKCSNM